MNITDLLETVHFSIGNLDITLGQVLGFGLVFLILAVAFWVTNKRILPYYLKKDKLEADEQKRLGRIISLIFFLLLIIGTLFIFEIDMQLFKDKPFMFRVSKIFIALLIIQFARISDWLVSKVMVQNYYARDTKDEKKDRSSIEKDSMKNEWKATRIIQYIVYIVSAIFIIRYFHLENTQLDLSTPEHTINLSASNLLTAILIIFLARLFAWPSGAAWQTSNKTRESTAPPGGEGVWTSNCGSNAFFPLHFCNSVTMLALTC